MSPIMTNDMLNSFSPGVSAQAALVHVQSDQSYKVNQHQLPVRGEGVAVRVTRLNSLRLVLLSFLQRT